MASLNNIEANEEEFMFRLITGDEYDTESILKVKSSPNSGFHVDLLD